MTSSHPVATVENEQRIEHARRVLHEASDGLLTADTTTLYWVAVQVPVLLDVIDDLLPEVKK